MTAEQFKVDRRGFLQSVGAGILASMVPPHMLDLVQASPESVEKVASIEDGALALIELIREVSRLQAKTWQEVPALALEANGRSGYAESYALAYEDGLWELQTKINTYGRSGFCVDLENGELVDLFSKDENKNLRLARNEFVLLLALNMDQIDATKTVEELKERAREETFYAYDPVEQENWRKSLRERYNLIKPSL